jgi:hypothetical protein
VRVLRAAAGLVPLGPEDYEHLIPFHAGPRFDFAYVREVVLEFFEDARAELTVRHFPTTKPDRGFNLVAVLQPLTRMLHAIVVIVIVGAGTELHFLDRDRDLLLLGLVRFLLCLVLVLAEVDDSAHRGIGIRSNFHEVQSFIPGGADGVAHIHHAELLSFLADDPYFGHSNSFVNTYRRYPPVIRTLTATAKACSYSAPPKLRLELQRVGGVNAGTVELLD